MGALDPSLFDLTAVSDAAKATLTVSASGALPPGLTRTSATTARVINPTAFGAALAAQQHSSKRTAAFAGQRRSDRARRQGLPALHRRPAALPDDRALDRHRGHWAGEYSAGSWTLSRQGKVLGSTTDRSTPLLMPSGTAPFQLAEQVSIDTPNWATSTAQKNVYTVIPTPAAAPTCAPRSRATTDPPASGRRRRPVR